MLPNIPLTRTKVYEGETFKYGWQNDMLTAVRAALALGVPRIELEVHDATRDVPKMVAAGRDWMGNQSFQQDGTQEDAYSVIRVYAIRVDVSDEVAS